VEFVITTQWFLPQPRRFCARIQVGVASLSLGNRFCMSLLDLAKLQKLKQKALSYWNPLLITWRASSISFFGLSGRRSDARAPTVV